jgi:hypothetical protein
VEKNEIIIVFDERYREAISFEILASFMLLRTAERLLVVSNRTFVPSFM